MKYAIAGICLVVAVATTGCGGGGGGGGIPQGLSAGTTRGGNLARFSPNVVGANVNGAQIQIYGDERSGPVNAYTVSRRLTITLYGPVTAGRSFTVNASRSSGSAYVSYITTENQNGQYITTGTWEGSGGSITVSAVDNSHVEGTFDFQTNIGPTPISWSNGQFNITFETPPPPL